MQAGVCMAPCRSMGCMEELLIRKAGGPDLVALQAIGRATFQETVAASNSPEDMAEYMGKQFGGEQMAAEPAYPGSRFFLAEHSGRTVGYLKLNSGSAQTEPMGPVAVEIERIHVLRECCGSGVGQQLCNKALDVARTLGARSPWLGVWEHNSRAIAFYRRNGFEEFGEHLFMHGNNEQRNVLMRRRVGE